jgi:hypothetical protein
MSYGSGTSLVNRMFLEAWGERRQALKRYYTLGLAIGYAKIGAYLKRRKRVNLDDQKVARLLFFGARRWWWHQKIDGNVYSDSRPDMSYLPIEVAEELGTTVPKVEAAIARVARELTGKNPDQLISEYEAKEAARLAAIPVPEPTLPRRIQRLLRIAGPAPSYADAVALVYEYCEAFRLGRPHEDRDQADRVAAIQVDEHIKGRMGADYRAVWRCVDVVLRGKPKSII